MMLCQQQEERMGLGTQGASRVVPLVGFVLPVPLRLNSVKSKALVPE